MGLTKLNPDDALLIVDVQNDFLPGGSLPVPRGDEVVPVLRRYLALFEEHHLPIFASRDWHPPNHCSFRERGGPWPPHCIAGTPGADIARDLALPPTTILVNKAETPHKDAYSAFEGTSLDHLLRTRGVRRLFVGGLATDYCVLNTVRDALSRGYAVVVLADAIRAVNARPDDGVKAEAEMQRLGARLTCFEDVAT
jgi:nicotinamidase/pyrazinamidase